MKKSLPFFLLIAFLSTQAQKPASANKSSNSSFSSSNSLVNTLNSKHTVLSGTDIGSVKWTQGFWADRFAILRDSMLPRLKTG